MTEPVTFADRLRKGLVRIDAEATSGSDGEPVTALRRTLACTLARLAASTDVGASLFRLEITPGKPLLLYRNEALALEPGRLFGFLNSMEVELLNGDSLDVDGDLAAWMIRPEVNLTDTNLRRAEEGIRALKSARSQDSSAFHLADSMKTRLRSRLTQLVGALQAAQGSAAGATEALAGIGG